MELVEKGEQVETIEWARQVLPGSGRGREESSPCSALSGGGVGGPGSREETRVPAGVGNWSPQARFPSGRKLIGDI